MSSVIGLNLAANKTTPASSGKSLILDLLPVRGNPTVSVVIPTLNEAKNLPYVLPLIPEWVDEVILVDGRSTDGTVEVARKLMPNIRVVNQKGRGKGNALRAGFEAATGDIIVMLDADGSTSPAEIPAFVGVLLSGAGFAKGSRFMQGGGTADMEFHRRLGNLFFTLLTRVMFGGGYTDLCYGYNAFWRSALPYLEIDCDGFEVETLMNLRALYNGIKVVEVASFESPRRFGTSNLHAVRDGWRVLKTIFKEYARHRKQKQVAIPEISVTRRGDPATPSVELLLSEALHFVFHGSRNASPEASKRTLEAVHDSLAAVVSRQGAHADAEVPYEFVLRFAPAHLVAQTPSVDEAPVLNSAPDAVS